METKGSACRVWAWAAFITPADEVEAIIRKAIDNGVKR